MPMLSNFITSLRYITRKLERALKLEISYEKDNLGNRYITRKLERALKPL